jgi:1-acyl-sn-glycerol-3-phosphate acyltransferase
MTASITAAPPSGLGHRLWFGRALPLLVARLFTGRIRVTGGERVPPAGPVLFVGRHRAGLMDGWLYAHALPRPTVFVIAARLRRTLLLRPLVAGIAVMRRKDGGDDRGAVNHAALLACRDELAAGRTLFIFPEGTSSLDPRPLPLEPGAARLALAVPGIAVVPVGIQYADPVRVGTGVSIGFGVPLYLPPDATVEQAQAAMAAALEAVKADGAVDRLPLWAEAASMADRPVRWLAALAGTRLADDDTAVLTWATMIGLPLQLLWSAGLLTACCLAGWPWLGAGYVALLAARLMRPTERRRA